jgi:hypothetical protein
MVVSPVIGLNLAAMTGVGLIPKLRIHAATLTLG